MYKFNHTILIQSLSYLTSAGPHVYGLGVGDRGQLGGDTRGLGGHGEQRGHPQGHPGGDGVLVQPEADPGHDDQHAARDVDCQQVVGELPLKRQVHSQAAVLACKITRVSYCSYNLVSKLEKFVKETDCRQLE